TSFVRSMFDLVASLQKKEPHYVRCIKPNDKKAPRGFDEQLVRHQVRYLGLVENVRVRRAGFCYRTDYDRFLLRYKLVSDRTYPTYRGNDGVQGAVRALLVDAGIKEDEFRFGKTKIFIRSPRTLTQLEALRESRIPKAVVCIQRMWRGYAARQLA